MKIFTVDEVANELKIDKQTVMDQIKKGKLLACRVGRFWRVLENDLMEFLKGKGKTGAEIS